MSRDTHLFFYQKFFMMSTNSNTFRILIISYRYKKIRTYVASTLLKYVEEHLDSQHYFICLFIESYVMF